VMWTCWSSLRRGRRRFRNLMGPAFYLEDLFGRRVDLITVGGLDPFSRMWSGEVVWCEA